LDLLEIIALIMRLAEVYEDPVIFVDAVQKETSKKNYKNKGDLFLKAANTIFDAYPDHALALWKHASTYFSSQEDKADCYINIGIGNGKLKRFEIAIESLERALQLAQGIVDDAKKKEKVFACLFSLGQDYQSLGHYQKAIGYHRRALKIAVTDPKKINDEFSSLAQLAFDYAGINEYYTAIEFREKAANIARRQQERLLEAHCYILIGIYYKLLGNYRKAIEYHGKTLEIAKEIEDKKWEEAAYTNLGNIYYDQSYYQKAIEYHGKTLEIAKEIEDKYGEAAARTNLGNSYYNLYDYRKAIEYHGKTLEIAKEIREAPRRTHLGGGLDAVEYDFIKSFAQEIEEGSLEASCYGNLGICYERLGDGNIAIKYHTKALQLAQQIKDENMQALCHMNLGNVYYGLEHYDNAIKYHTKALQLAQQIGNQNLESTCYVNLANDFLYRVEDSPKVLPNYEKALQIAERTGQVDLQRIINFSLGRIYEEEGNSSVACSYLEHSIELSENIAGQLIGEEHKLSFNASLSDAYQLIVPLYLRRNDKVRALEYAERSRSRTFLEILAASNIEPAERGKDELDLLIKKEEELLVKFRAVQLMHLRNTPFILQPGETDNIRRKLREIYEMIASIDTEYAFLRSGRPAPLNRIQKILSQNENAILVEYFVTHDKIFIFVISLNDLHVEIVDFSYEKLVDYIKHYHKEVAESRGKDAVDTCIELSRYLIEPIVKYLSKDQLIYFVPYGLLHYIPLHALFLNRDPLIRNHPIVYSPNASLLQFYKRKGSNSLKSCASFGVDFPFEAENIAEIFNSQPYIDATKATVLENIRNKDVLHFSCHGLFDNSDPLSSGILLYNDKYPKARDILTAREIFNLELKAELVTLSACETGINEIKPGEELIGLTRGFLYAGAASVMVSLWSVNAPSTQRLMREFYTQLKGGKDKASALQQAQIKTMETNGYEHPYYWAPFVLIGDWG
jgi:CHAT domain-containing protein/tetratricopeptide (TPR) repeat protein